ncbi:hypothetical protein J6590_010982 [Homalodisca vitripennis]|nr:hypothetical protein J6590_010982 [Homalodisca vitripennis]
MKITKQTKSNTISAHNGAIILKPPKYTRISDWHDFWDSGVESVQELCVEGGGRRDEVGSAKVSGGHKARDGRRLQDHPGVPHKYGTSLLYYHCSLLVNHEQGSQLARPMRNLNNRTLLPYGILRYIKMIGKNIVSGSCRVGRVASSRPKLIATECSKLVLSSKLCHNSVLNLACNLSLSMNKIASWADQLVITLTMGASYCMEYSRTDSARLIPGNYRQAARADVVSGLGSTQCSGYNGYRKINGSRNVERVTAERSCPCKRSACPAIGGGSQVIFKALVPRLSVKMCLLYFSSGKAPLFQSRRHESSRPVNLMCISYQYELTRQNLKVLRRRVGALDNSIKLITTWTPGEVPTTTIAHTLTSCVNAEYTEKLSTTNPHTLSLVSLADQSISRPAIQPPVYANPANYSSLDICSSPSCKCNAMTVMVLIKTTDSSIPTMPIFDTTARIPTALSC